MILLSMIEQMFNVSQPTDPQWSVWSFVRL